MIWLSARNGQSITNWILSSQKRLLVDLPQSPQLNKQKTLSTFVDKESQQQMYAELAAVDLTGTQRVFTGWIVFCKAEDQPQ